MDNGHRRDDGPATQARGSLPAQDRPGYRRTAYSEHEGGGGPGAGTVLALVAAGALTATAIGVATKRRHQDERPEDDAPRRAALRHRIGDYALVGRTVTINKPKAELYAFFRDFSNLPAFMENLEAVEPVSGQKDRNVWKIAGPAGRTVDVETDVAEDVKNEKIAWRSTEGSDIDTSGHIVFRDAPQNRGTEIELVIAYEPPMGAAGRAVAKLFQREPHIQARRDLKRFKMLMETGEIATSKNRRDL
jgi:uncharacterized membrane protein